MSSHGNHLPLLGFRMPPQILVHGEHIFSDLEVFSRITPC